MKVIVKNARMSFNALFKPKAFGDNPDPKFSLTAICSDDTTVKVQETKPETGEVRYVTKPHSFLKKVCDRVFKEKFGKLDAVYSNWVYNKADGSDTRKKFVDKTTGDYRPGTDADTFLIDAATKEADAAYKHPETGEVVSGKIQVVDQKRQLMKDNDARMYSGCYINFSIDVYAFDHPKSGKGVSAQLVGVQLKADGERFGGGGVTDATTEFDDEEIDEEDEADDGDWD